MVPPPEGRCADWQIVTLAASLADLTPRAAVAAADVNWRIGRRVNFSSAVQVGVVAAAVVACNQERI